MLFSLHINNLALTLPCNPFKVKARIFVESLQLTYFLMTPHIKITFSLALKLCVIQTISSWLLQVKLNPGALEFDHILKSSMLDESITAVTSRHSACFYNLHVLLTCR